MYSRILFLYLMTVLLGQSGLFATTIIVTPGGSPTIQEAINSADSGDTISLTNGTFTSNGSYYISFLGKAVTVRSQSENPDSCTIDCESSWGGIRFVNGEDSLSVLEGITISNAYTYGYPGVAGVWCIGASPTIRNCVIRNCQSRFGNDRGGGVVCDSASSPGFEQCRIVRNFGTAGVACMRASSPSFLECEIDSNIGLLSGGVFCDGYSSPTFTNCQIIGNYGHKGGGVGCRDHSSPIFDHCIICLDTAQDGGGVACSDSSFPVFANDCVLSRNYANINGQGFGGGLFADSAARPSLEDCHLDSNHASTNGGGAAGGGSFSNCSISWNEAHDYGGGIAGGSFELTGCNLIRNTAWSGGGIYLDSFSTFTECGITDNWSFKWGGGITTANSYVSAVFFRCKIDRNVTNGGTQDAKGGGVFCSYNTDLEFTNCQFDSNYAGQEGGAVYIEPQSSIPTQYPHFKHCTFTRNSLGIEGTGGIAAGYALELRSCIIAFSIGAGVSLGDAIDTSGYNIQHCDLFGNSGGDLMNGRPEYGVKIAINANGDSCDAYHNIFENPQFLDTSGHNFHLNMSSPCIGAADSALGVRDDIEEVPRPNPAGSEPDIGAYEHLLGSPKAPTGLVIRIIRNGNNVLYWPSWGAPHYKVYGALTPSAEGDTLATVTDTTWTDNQTVNRPSRYFYYIKAEW